MIWAALICALAIPIALAAQSPLLAWRGPVYIAAGFAGIVAFALVLAQPLLAGGYLPGLPPRRGRRVHRLVGLTLVAAIVAHVAGLWLTSPPDVIDALLFDSPTPFSVWGVLAMWAAFAAALLALLREPMRLGPRLWRLGHTGLALVVVAGSVAHALLIEGAMETISKAALCALVVAATATAVFDLRAWALLRRRRN
ncbi:MAG: ferric reductase-like transmembrane domain-containing protein [Methylobacteriaceae bacterium]|nr:ferric reductase-like transmembrane domain-containing protein [Methylobacteriaceae bacterium]